MFGDDKIADAKYLKEERAGVYRYALDPKSLTSTSMSLDSGRKSIQTKLLLGSRREALSPTPASRASGRRARTAKKNALEASEKTLKSLRREFLGR
jgi:hypothetical protein